MRLIDISVPISKDTIMWEDEFLPLIEMFSSLKKGDIANSSFIKMSLHTSTHIDFPLHFLDTGKKSDEINIKKFYGKVFVVEIKDEPISASVFEKSGIPLGTKKLLIKTSNSRLYKESGFSKDFNALCKSGADWIVNHDIELVGIDYLSIEKYENDNYYVHKTLLGNEILILEGINLENVKEGEYTLFALPLKIKGVEASPVRAFLLEGL